MILNSMDVAALPADVPDSVKETYRQASVLINISPKAAGALARGCLQMMIYDFWKIAPRNKGTLLSEFEYISTKLPQETKDSIEYVRKIGTIEAQLSQNVNMMVGTTVPEAKMLVTLIQLLFQDWYGDRSRRLQRHEDLRTMAQKTVSDLPLELTKVSTLQLEGPNEAGKDPDKRVHKGNSKTRRGTGKAAPSGKQPSITPSKADTTNA